MGTGYIGQCRKGYWFPSWTTWGSYYWDKPMQFLNRISGNKQYIYTYDWGCWNGDPKFFYGW